MKFTELFAREKFEKDEMWIKDNLLYECIMGSQAYGLSTPESDVDFVSIVMDKEEHLYPHKYGFIRNFEQAPNFEQKSIKGPGNKLVLEDGRDVEGEWNSLTRFFYLAGVKGSPSLIETLFVRRPLVIYSHKIGYMLRDNNQKFLSMRTFNALKGYAWQQLMRIKRGLGKEEYRESTRFEMRHELEKSYSIDEIKEEIESRNIS